MKFNHSEAGKTYQYAELQFQGASIGADISGKNELWVWRQDFAHAVTVNSAIITPKKLRKFARALLALADQVDPPVSYFHYTEPIEMFYRVNRRDGVCEYWRTRGNEWAPSSNFKWLKKNRDLIEITPDALPLAARPA